jgi:hypothetical protein
MRFGFSPPTKEKAGLGRLANEWSDGDINMKTRSIKRTTICIFESLGVVSLP